MNDHTEVLSAIVNDLAVQLQKDGYQGAAVITARAGSEAIQGIQEHVHQLETQIQILTHGSAPEGHDKVTLEE